MHGNLVTLRPDVTVAEAARQIKAQRHSNYPMVDQAGKYLGTISREDLYCVLKSSSASLETPVSTLELRQLPVAGPDATAAELIELMLTRGSNKVWINAKDGTLAGIVTLLDLVCETEPANEGDESTESTPAEASAGAAPIG